MPKAPAPPRDVFELSKWYLDGTTDDGDVVIAYAAEVRWRALTLRYVSTLVARAGEEPAIVRASLRGAPPPAIEGAVIAWAAPALGVSARFEALAPAVSDVVLANDDGRVDWTCVAPRARASFHLEDGAIDGLGYVEHLRLAIPPWRLPIDELRWGRFLGRDASLVWIDWRGPHARRVAFLDVGGKSAAVGFGRVDDDGFASDDGATRLDVTSRRVLREGALGKTALAILPAVETLLPVRILATEERKWLSRGTLHHAGKTHDGLIVHEVVRWP